MFFEVAGDEIVPQRIAGPLGQVGGAEEPSRMVMWPAIELRCRGCEKFVQLLRRQGMRPRWRRRSQERGRKMIRKALADQRVEQRLAIPRTAVTHRVVQLMSDRLGEMLRE